MKCPLMQEAEQKEQVAAGSCILLPFHTPTTRHEHTHILTGPHRHSMMIHSANRLNFDKIDRLKTGGVNGSPLQEVTVRKVVVGKPREIFLLLKILFFL